MLDRFPVADLSQRYKIGKSAVYDRLKVLAIQPIRDGRKSYISTEDLERLDELDRHFSAGGTLETFHALPGTLAKSSGERTVEGSAATFLALAKFLQQRSPVDNYRDLDEAIERRWLLTSHQVEQLLGVKPSPLPRQDFFDRACWRFRKAGKIGRETAWVVERRPGFNLPES